MNENVTLRNELARERTLMSNERTFLTYINTTLAFIGLAIVIYKFASPDIVFIGCAVSLALSVFVFFLGLRNYRSAVVRIRNGVHEDPVPAKPVEPVQTVVAP
jgi:putative membrane protein